MPTPIGPSLEASDAAADRLNAHIERGLQAIADEVAARVEEQETAAEVSPADLALLTVLWLVFIDSEIMSVLGDIVAEVSAEQAQAFVSALGLTGTPFASMPVFSEPIDTQEYLLNARNRLVGIGDELWENARTSLAEGVAAGESMPNLADRIREAASVTQPRARVIARTEAHGARQSVAMATTTRIAAESGNPSAIRKQWQATEDERTRPTHHAADGQIAALDAPFSVGLASLAFPGDPTGPPGETINCRCVSLSIIDVSALRNAFTANSDELISAAAYQEEDAMPWHIAEGDSRCNAGEFAVVKDADNELEGCHETRAEAEAQLAALYASEEDDDGDAFSGGVLTASVRRGGWGSLPVASADHAWSGPGAASRVAASCGVDAEDAGTSAWNCYARNFLFRDEDANPQTRGAYKLGVVDIVDGERTLIPRGVFAVAAVLQGARGGADIPSAQQATLRTVVAGLYDRINRALDTEHEVPWRSAASARTMSFESESIVGHRYVAVSGPIVVEGRSTGDRRQFGADSLTWQDVGATDSLEIPIGYQYERGHGSGGSDRVARVGRIDAIERRDDGTLYARGVIDLSTERGREAAAQMGTQDEPGTLAGVSVVVDEDPDGSGLTVEFQFPEHCELAEDGTDQACMMPEQEIISAGARIRAVDLVDIPAFAEARLYLDSPLVPETVPEDDAVLTASAYTITIPDLPPAEWFSEPKDGPDIGAITVTDDGRIFGYLAPKRVAHRGYRDKRVEVPTGNVDYGIWMNRVTLADDGNGGFTRLSTGPITMDCGHASASSRVVGSARREHYDNSCSVVATVRAGENEHGVWISGALLPDVSAEQVRRMMACQLSGDWGPHREQPGKRELAAALLVPVPGFPKRSSSFMSMSGQHIVHVAVPVRFAMTEQNTKTYGLKAAVDNIAASIGRDRVSRIRAFAAQRQAERS